MYVLVLLSLLVNISHGQNLLGAKTRIWKLPKSKKSIFHSKGIFHNGGPKRSFRSSLKAIRHSYSSQRGHERVVLDFSTHKVPKIYGYFAANNKTLYLDLFGTDLKYDVGSFGITQYVESINIYPWSRNSLSVELNFKEKVNVDVFYIDSPGRLVVDVKS